MELESEIRNLRSKQQVEKIVRWIGTNANRFAQIMKLFLHGDQDISRRSAWVVSHCGERHPELVKPWLKAIIKRIQEPNIDNAIQRSIMRVLQYAEIPKSVQGTVANICFNYISDTKTAIGPQAFAMTVLSNIAKREPDLLKELSIIVRQMLPYGTPAFRARAKKIFKDLKEEDTAISRNEEDTLLHEWLKQKE
jgi:hypothetical protein